METSSRREEHVRIIRSLADGVDPFTGELLARDSLHQHPDVVRALMGVLHALDLATKGRRRDLPANSGKAWSEADDESLAAAFDTGTSIPDLARAHQRTTGAVRARLQRLGRIEDDGHGGWRAATRVDAGAKPGDEAPGEIAAQPVATESRAETGGAGDSEARERG